MATASLVLATLSSGECCWQAQVRAQPKDADEAMPAALTVEDAHQEAKRKREAFESDQPARDALPAGKGAA